MGSRKGLFFAIRERFDQLMAIGESRYQAKCQARASVGKQWSVSSGRIHSWGTRKTYQEHVRHFARWAKEQHGIRRLDQLDHRAAELAPLYLGEQIQACRSAYTIAAQRSALRLFFAQRELAAEVSLPKRRREQIRRSRGVVAHDKHFQPAHWAEHITFAQATGLRRSEMRDVRIHEVYHDQNGRLCVYVRKGKGGRARLVPVLPEREGEIRAIVEGRNQDERVFKSIPKHMDVHAYRRGYAQEYYQLLSGRELPSPLGTLKPADYDERAVREVSAALGHSRKDVILRHYLR